MASMTVTVLWALSFAVVIEIACHVPFLFWSQVSRIRTSWSPRFKEPGATWRLRMLYRWRLVQIALAALVTQALCLSWVVMAGLYSGLLGDLARFVGAGS